MRKILMNPLRAHGYLTFEIKNIHGKYIIQMFVTHNNSHVCLEFIGAELRMKIINVSFFFFLSNFLGRYA